MQTSDVFKIDMAFVFCSVVESFMRRHVLIKESATLKYYIYVYLTFIWTLYRAIAMLDPAIIFLLAICSSYMLGSFVSVLSTIFTFLVAVIFRLQKLKVMMEFEIPQYLVVFITGIVTMVSQVVWVISSVFFYALPFVIICTLLSLVHMNHELIVGRVIQVYNSNISESTALVFFRQGLLLVKIFAESVLPMYNFLLNLISTGGMEVLNVIFGNTQMTQRIMQLALSVFNMGFEVFRALGTWKLENISRCGSMAMDEINAGITENDYCLHYIDGTRALSLATVEERYQEIGVEFQSIVTILCPSIAPVVVVMLYPLIDVVAIRILENVGNLILALGFTMWDVTALRCKIAKESPPDKGYARTSLCILDVGPLFEIAKLAVSNLGVLVDNWLQHAVEFVIRFFYVTEDLQSAGNGGVARVSELQKKFPGHVSTRALVLASSLYVVTDGKVMHVYDEYAVATPVFEVVIQPAIEPRYGVAPVTHLENELFDNGRANYETGVFGCSCSDTNQQVQISCRVAHARKMSDVDQAPQSDAIQVFFQNPWTAGILRSCQNVMIHVQPLRFEERFVGPDRTLDNLWEAENDELLQTECLKNWKECSSADAVIYVQPICTENMLGTALCIDHFEASCFPYCIGYHQRGVGVMPITLFKKRALTDGVFLANMDCSTELPTIDTSQNVQAITGYASAGTVTDTRMQAVKQARNAFCYRATNAGTVLQEPVDLSGFEVPERGDSVFFIINGQATLFAGNLIVSAVNPVQTNGQLEHSGSIDLSMTAYNNFYQLKRDLTGIPVMKMREAQKLGTYAGRLFVPEDSIDSRVARIITVGAQVANGFVYAVNPSNLFLKTTRIKGTAIIQQNSFIPTRIFLAKPRLMCTKARHLYHEFSEQPVYVNCLPNVIRKIDLRADTVEDGTDADDFIQYAENMDTVADKIVNYYVENIQMLDSVNVLITTVSGKYNDWPEAFDGTETCKVCSHVHYYLNTKTLRIRKHHAWPTPSLQKQYFIPRFGTLAAKMSSYWLTITSTIANKYLLNFMGLLEEIFRNDLNTQHNQAQLCVYALRHSAYENCQIQPLSVQGAYSAFVEWELEVARFGTQLVMWFEMFTGVPTTFGSQAEHAFSIGLEQDAGLIRSAGGGVATAIRGVSTGTLAAMSTSMHAAFFVYEDLMLEFVRRYLMLFSNTDNSADDVFYIFVLVLYEAIEGANNPFDVKIASQGTLVCRNIGSLLGESIDKPLGSFIFHSCVSGFLFPKAVIRYLSSVMILFPASRCICLESDAQRISGIDLSMHRCYRLLPPNLKHELQNQQRGVANTCAKSIQVLEQAMYQAPVEFWGRLDRAITSVRGIPNQLAEWFSIPLFLGMECGDIQNTADSLVLLPKPMSEFRRCAFTATCFDKCRNQLDDFYNLFNEKMNPSVPNTRVTLNVPVQLPPVKVGWKVVAVENYGSIFMGNCMNTIAMLLFRTSGGRNEWKFLAYCHVRQKFVFELVYEISLTEYIPMNVQMFGAASDAPAPEIRDIRFVPPDANQIPILFLVYDAESTIKQHVYELRIDTTTRSGEWQLLFNSLLFTMEPNMGGCQQQKQRIIQMDSMVHTVNEISMDIYTQKHTEELSREGQPYATHSNKILQFFVLPTMGGYNMFLKVEIVYSRVQDGIPDPEPSHMVLHYRITRILSASGSVECTTLKNTQSTEPGETNVLRIFSLANVAKAILWASDNMFVFIHKNSKGVIQLTSHQFITSSDSNEKEDSFYTNAPQNALFEDKVFTQGSSVVESMLHYGLPNFKSKYNTRPIFSAHVFAYGGEKAVMNPILQADMSVLNAEDVYFSVHSLQVSAKGTYSFVLHSHTDSSEISVKETCTHVNCGNCNSEDLRQLCYIAERCTLRRCVGTLLDTNNAFCASGAFMTYALEFMSEQDSSVFYIVTEVLIAAVRSSVGLVNQQQPFDIISMSNYYNTNLCKVKDVIMSASALLPSFLYTLYRMAQHAMQAFTGAVFSQLRFWQTQVIEVEPADLKGASMATRVVTQLIAQVLMGVIFLFLRDGDIFLCASTELMEFLEGFDIEFVRGINANIVRNMGTLNVDTATHGDVDICDVGFKGDSSTSGYSMETDELRTIARLRGTLSPNTLANTMQSQGLALSDLKNAFDNFAGMKSTVQRLYARLKWSNLLKYIIGITFAFSDLMVYANLDACVINDLQFTNVFFCACGDVAYAIPPHKAEHSHGWCTGVLRMKTYGGDTVYIYNPYSYAYLQNALESYAQMVQNGVENDELERARESLYTVNFAQISSNKYKVPPLSILMTCRNNYWHKTWDRGVFAGFSTDVRFTPSSDSLHAQVMSGFVETSASSVGHADTVKNCLRFGPTVNTATACTELMFSTMSSYFMYTETVGITAATGNDACGYLSNANTPKACRATDALSSSCRTASTLEERCRHGQNEVTINNMAYVNLVNNFPIENHKYNAAVIQEARTNLRECTRDGFVIPWRNKLFETSQNANEKERFDEALDVHLKLKLISNEGDVLHNYADCVMLGPDTRRHLLPVDTDADAQIENLLYEKLGGTNSTCPTRTVFDTNAKPVLSETLQTCGTSARISVIKHMQDKMTGDNFERLKADIRNVLIDNVLHVENENSYTSLQNAELPGKHEKTWTDIFQTTDVDLVLESLTNITFWTRYQTAEMQTRLQNYPLQKPLRENMDVQYPFQGVMTGSDRNYEFPLTRSEEPLTLAAECHMQLRTSMLSHELEDATFSGTNDTYVTFKKLKSMLAQQQEWRPLHKAHANASRHNQDTRERFVADLFHQSESANVLDLLYDIRFVSEMSQFCPDPLRMSSSRQKLYNGHQSVELQVQERLSERLQSEGAENLKGYDFEYDNKVLGNFDMLCPCSNADMLAGDTCSIDKAVCAILSLDERQCFDQACGESVLPTATNVTYEVTQLCTLAYIRDFLSMHAQTLHTHGFVCDSFLPSNLWGLDFESVDIPNYYSHIVLKNGISVQDVIHAKQRAARHLHEGRRLVNFSSFTDPDYTTARNILCETQEFDGEFLAKYAFPAVSFLRESKAVVTCTAYIMEHGYGDFLEALGADQNMQVEFEDVVELARGRAEKLKSQCASLLKRLETCRISGAYDETIVRDTSTKARERSCCENVNVVISPELNADSAATYCIKHECTVALMLNPVQYFDLQQCEQTDTQSYLLHPACRRVGMRCPFTYEPEYGDEFSFLPAPCLVIRHALNGANELEGTLPVFYDPVLCVSSGADIQNPIVMYKSWFQDHCRIHTALELLSLVHEEQTGVHDLPRLSSKYVTAVLQNQQSALRTGFFSTSSNEDWWEPRNKTGAWSPMPTIPYWPAGWEGAPHGELLTDDTAPASGLTFSTYMAFIEDAEQPHFAVLPNHLRFENYSTLLYGSSGFCREPTWGMPMELMNLNQICLVEHDTNQAEETLCTQSSSVNLGGTMHESLGHWWGLLFPFLTDDFAVLDATSELAAGNLFELDYDESFVVPEHGQALQSVVEMYCQDDFSVHNDGQHLEQTHCYHNKDCKPNQVCTGDTGECTEVKIGFASKNTKKVDLGVYSKKCKGQGKHGASPYENVQGLLQLHGMCSHNNYVNYRYLLQRARHAPECTRHSDANATFYECKRDLVFYWLTQNPLQLPLSAAPGVTDDVQNGVDIEETIRKMTENGLFQLEPSACDLEYTVDSEELRWCTLQPTDDDKIDVQNPTVGKWMRMSASDKDTFAFMDTASLYDEIGTDYAGISANDPNTELLKNKLRFLGMDENAIQVNQFPATTLMNTCGAYGICQTVRLQVAGSRVTRKRDGGVNVNSNPDLKLCHSFGYLADGKCVGNVIECMCVLDKHVNALFYAMYSIDKPVDCDFIRRPDPPPYLTWNQSNWVYTVEKTENVQNFLYEMFFYTQEVSLESHQVKIGVYKQIHQCCIHVQNYLGNLNTIETLYDAKINAKGTLDLGQATERTVHKRQGVYLFYKYAAHEVPLLWFFKMKCYSLFFEYKIERENLYDEFIPVSSFDRRLDYSDFHDQELDFKLENVWADATLRADALEEDNVFDVINKAFGRQYHEFLSTNGHVTYAFRQPKNLTLEKPAFEGDKYKDDMDSFGGKDFVKLFEEIAYTVHHTPLPIQDKIAKFLNTSLDHWKPHSEYENPFISRFVQSESLYEEDMKQQFSGEMPVWNLIDENQVSWFELAFGDITKMNVQIISPFDSDTKKLGKNDVLEQSGDEDEDELLLKLATFTLDPPNTDSTSDEFDSLLHETNKRLLSQLISTPLTNPEDVFTHENETGSTACIYNRQFYESMYREGDTYGIFSDSDPEFSIYVPSPPSPCEDGTLVRTMTMCGDDANKDREFRSYNAITQDGMPCNFNLAATNAYVDFDPATIPAGNSETVHTSNFDADNREFVFRNPEGVQDREPHQPSVGVAGAFYRKKVDGNGASINQQRSFANANAICHRLDLHCVTQNIARQKDKLWEKEHDWKDDTFTRIKNNAYTQGTPEYVRSMECNDDEDCKESKEAYATRKAYDAFLEDPFKNSDKLYRNAFTTTTNDPMSKIKPVCVHVEHMTELEKNGFDIKYYKINDEFKDLIQGEEQGLGILTAKDRLYAKLARSTTPNYGPKQQPVFGHFEKEDDQGEKRKVIPTPGYSFCPGLLQKDEDEFDRLHHYKIVDYTAVGKTRFNNQIYNAEIKNTDFKIRKFKVMADQIYEKQSSKTFHQVNLNENEQKRLDEDTYDANYEFDVTNEEEFKSQFSTLLKKLLFTKFSFSETAETDFDSPEQINLRSFTPRLINPLVHHREAKVNVRTRRRRKAQLSEASGDNYEYLSGREFTWSNNPRDDSVGSMWPVYFPWKRRGKMNADATNSWETSWQNLDYLTCDIEMIFNNNGRGLSSDTEVHKTIKTWSEAGWCPRYSGTKSNKKADCLYADQAVRSFTQGNLRLAKNYETAELNAFKKYTCVSDDFARQNSYSDRIGGVDLYRNPISQITYKCPVNYPKSTCVECSDAERAVCEPWIFGSVNTIKNPNFALSMFYETESPGLGVGHNTNYDYWVNWIHQWMQDFDDLYFITNTEVDRPWSLFPWLLNPLYFITNTENPFVSGIDDYSRRSNERDFFEDIICDESAIGDVDSTDYLTPSAETRQGVTRRCRGTQNIAGHRSAGSVAWPFVSGYDPSTEFPHVARIGWYPSDAQLENFLPAQVTQAVREKVRKFWQYYIQHDHLFPWRADFFPDNAGNIPPERLKQPFTLDETDYVLYNAPVTPDLSSAARYSFEIGALNCKNTMHNHFNYLPKEITRQNLIANEVAYVMRGDTSDVVRFTADVETQTSSFDAYKFRDFNDDPTERDKVCEYTRPRLDAHAGRSNIFRAQRAGTGNPPSNQSRPCNIPQMDRAENQFEINYLDLANCYEFDIHQTPDWRPWWTYSACDMGRGILDQTTNHYALTEWLGWDMPKHFTLNFLTDFVSTFVNAVYGGYHGTSDWVDFDTNGAADATFWDETNRVTDAELAHPYQRSMANHFQERDEFYKHNEMTLAPREAGKKLTDLTDFWHYLFGHQITPQGEDWVPLQLTGKSLGKNDMNSFTRYIMHNNDQCHLQMNSDHVFTKPTKWSEIDGTPGRHMVACAPDDTDESCQPLIVAVNMTDHAHNHTNSDIIVAYSIRKGSFFCVDEHYSDFKNPDQHNDNVHEMPFWVEDITEQRNTHKKGLWVKRPCKEFEENRDFMRLSRGNTMMAGIWRREANEYKLMTQVDDEMSKDLRNSQYGLKRFLGSTDIVQDLNNELANIYGKHVYEIKKTGEQDALKFELYLNYNQLKLKLNTEDPKYRREYDKYFLNKSIVDSFLSMQAEDKNQYCKMSGHIPQPFCPGTRYDAHKTIAHHINVEESLIKNCQQSNELHGEDTPAEFYDNFTLVNNLKNFTREILKNRYGLDVQQLTQNKNREFNISDSAFSWLADGIHVLASAATRDPHLEFLKNLLSKINLQQSWDDMASTEKTCYVTPSNKITVANPWFGGNYTFPIWSKFVNPRTGQPHLDGRDADVLRFMTGFDMCTLHQYSGSSKTTADYFTWSSVWPCHASECLHYDSAQRVAGLNLTEYLICDALSMTFNGTNESLRWPRFELLRRQMESSMVFFSNKEYFKTSTPDHDVCTQIPDTQTECHHPQTVLGRDRHQTRTHFTRATSLTQQSMHGRIHPQIFTLSTNMNKTLWNSKTVQEVLNTVARSNKVFTLLMDPLQTGPRKILLELTNLFHLYVKTIQLSDSPHNVIPRWQEQASAQMQQDEAKITQNKLYTGARKQTTSDQNWVCPLLKMDLFSFHEGLYRRHKELRLLTPDPVKMKEKYPSLSGMHPMVQTEYLHDKIVVNRRKRFRRLGPAFLFEDTANSSSHLPTWEAARNHVLDLINEVILKREWLPFDVHRGSVLRHAAPDWPNLGKTMRSNETHTPLASDKINLLPLNFSQYKVKMGKNKQDDSHAFQNTHAVGGDCFRNSTIVFNQSELEAVLSYDLCYQTLQHPGFLKCSKAGDRAYTFLPIRRRDPMISRKTTNIQALFATPMVKPPQKVHTKLYARKGQAGERMKYNELSLSSRTRLSPKYRMWMRLREFKPTTHMSFREMQRKWQNHEDSRLGHDRWRAVRTFENRSNDYFDCGDGNKLTMESGPTATSRQNLCRSYMQNQKCASFPKVAVNMCLLSLFGDYCKILAEWVSDVKRIIAAEKGLLQVSRQVYVPSMFHIPTSSFVYQDVRGSYVNIDKFSADGNKMCAAPTETYSTAQRDRDCPANFYARLIDTLGLLHDFGLQIWDFVLDMYELVEEFFIVLLSSIIQSFGVDKTQLSFPSVDESFGKMVRHLIRIVKTLATMCEQIFNAVWEMLKAAPFWNEIEELITMICNKINRIISWVTNFINDVTSAINSAASWIGLNINIPEVSIPDLECDLTLNFITDAFNAEDVSVTSTYCYTNIKSVQSFDELGSTKFTRDTCNANSFCINDVFDSTNVVKCGECTGAAYHCDLLVKSCKCGPVLDSPAKPCVKNADCMGSAQCSVLYNSQAAATTTMPCAGVQDQVVCLQKKSTEISALGECAILKGRGMHSYSDCERKNALQLNEFLGTLITTDGFCLVSNLNARVSAYRFENLAVMACSDLRAHTESTMCSTVHMHTDQYNKFVSRFSQTMYSSRRRLLGTGQHGSEMVLRFFEDNIGRVAQEDTCLQTARSCYQGSSYTTECLSCARLWWFWNATLYNTGHRDVDFMDMRFAVIEMLTNATLGRLVIRKSPDAAAQLVYDWLDSERAWAVLARFLPQAFGQRWLVMMTHGVNNLNEYHTLVQGAQLRPGHATTRRRRLLQAETHRDFGVTPPDVNATFLARELRNYYTDNRADTKLNANINIRQAQQPLQCTKNSYAWNGNFLVRFQTMLRLNGFSPLVECSSVEDSELGTCPLIMAPFLEVVKDTATLLEYYAHMQKSGCIYDGTKSCLKAPIFRASDMVQVIPKIASVPNTTTDVGGGIALQDQGIVLWIVLKVGNFVLDIFKPIFGDSRGHLLGFLQIDSYKNNTIYDELTRTNTWDLGRIIREFTECNFEQILHCNRIRSPLPMTIAGLMIFIITIHLFIPIHPVLSFFIWTGALTWGVPFLAYGFSPLCAPRIPVCYASDVHDFINWIVPAQMSVPRNLYNMSCASQGHNFTTSCLLSCENDNVRVDDAMSILYMLEPASTRGSTVITRKIVQALDYIPFLVIDQDAIGEHLLFFATRFESQDTDFVEGVVYCAGLQMYKLLALYIAFVILLPITIILCQNALNISLWLLYLVLQMSVVGFSQHTDDIV